jgi:pimeloyl-ACP methyl ester carboxylesterase
VGAARIVQPVIYVVGSDNAARLEPVMAMFRGAVPHTEFVVIAEADHNLQLTKATPVAETIAAFLHRHPM